MTNPLNPAVVEAVNQTLQDVVGGSVVPEGEASMAQSVGAGMAYQMVAQATALAVQDSVDFLRSTELVAQAVTAAVLIKMLENDTSSSLQDALTAAQNAVREARENFAAVGAAATQVATDFPSQ